MADYCGAKQAVASNSATSALHLACLAFQLGPGDILWTTPITFVASANCALYCGAEVDFVDIDPKTFDLRSLHSRKNWNTPREKERLPKVIIPVHLCGLPCEWKLSAVRKAIWIFCHRRRQPRHRRSYQDQPIGNCEYSDITVFSFHPVKIITTGEGGISLTNNEVLADKMKLLSSHGTTRDPALMTHEPDGDWYYQQVDLGYNYRMTDIQAALGLSQMSVWMNISSAPRNSKSLQ